MWSKFDASLKLFQRVYQDVDESQQSKTLIFHQDVYDEQASSAVDALLADVESRVQIKRISLAERNFLPYFPFLNWIREQRSDYSRSDWEQLCQKANIYQPQMQLFVRYLCGERPKREEEIIFNEIGYEQKRLLESLLALFCATFENQRTVFVIQEVGALSISSLRFIEYLVNASVDHPYLFLLTIQQNYQVSSEKSMELWGDLLNQIELSAIYMDMRNQTSVSSHFELDQSIPHTIDFGDLNVAEDCYQYLAFEDCQSIVDSILSRSNYAAGEMMMPLKHQLLLHRLQGDLLTVQGRFDSALLSYKAIIGMVPQDNYDPRLQYAYRKSGEVYFRKNNLDRAHKFTYHAQKLAKEAGDKEAEYYALFTLLLIDGKDNRITQTHWLQEYKRIVAMAEHMGMKNGLAFWMTRPDRFDDVRHKQEVSRILKKGIELAVELDNKARLAAAYHAQGLFHIMNNQYDKVHYYYQKSEVLTESIGSMLELAQIQNGYGYFYFQTNDYDNARRYFEKAFVSAYQVKDFTEMCMAICNIGIIHMFCFEYEYALDNFTKLSQVLKNLGVSDLPYHSQFGMMALSAFCHHKLWDFSRVFEQFTLLEAKRDLARSQARLQNFTEEVLLYKMLRGYVAMYDKDVTTALQVFAEAERFLNENRQIIGYYAPFFYYEYTLLCQMSGDGRQAAIQYKNGKRWSESLNNPTYMQMFGDSMSSFVSRPVASKERYPVIDYDRIIEATHATKAVLQLHEKLGELDFLNALQNIFAAAKDRDSLVILYMRLLNHSFPMDLLVFRIHAAGEAKTLFSFHPFLSNSDEERQLEALLRLYHVGNNFALPEPRTQFSIEQDFSSIASIPLESKRDWVAHILCGTNKGNISISASEYKLLTFSGKLLVSAIEKLEQEAEINEKNRELYLRATTDTLTQLDNRESAFHKLSAEQKKLKRYQGLSIKGLAVLFMDLDNFKFFNDRYGHFVGDALLVEFSQIIKSLIRECDVAARFGGDEFLIMLPNTSRTGAEHVAEKIIKCVKETNRFEQVIHRVSGEELGEITATGQRLGCSIGVACSPGNKIFDTEHMVNKADQALYQAKKSGKNRHVTIEL